MKKFLFVFFIIVPSIFAQVSAPEIKLTNLPGPLDNLALLITGLELLFVVIISANIIKFINITRKNKAFVAIYIAISLFLFNSVINLLYFISQILEWNISYIYLYLIERTIMLITFVFITIAFLRVNKLLRTKPK
jgi:hypothetical protein